MRSVADVVVKVECGNCGDPFYLTDLSFLGGFVVQFHEHWNEHHGGTNIHTPAVTVYAPVTS